MCIKNMLSAQTRDTRTGTPREPFQAHEHSDSSTIKEADSGAEMEGGSEVG